MFDIALTVDLQRAQLRVAQLNTATLEVNGRTLSCVQLCCQGQALQAVVCHRQLPALQCQLTLRRLQCARQVQAPFDLPLQTRP